MCGDGGSEPAAVPGARSALADVRGLQALGPTGDLELDQIPLGQALEPRPDDRTEAIKSHADVWRNVFSLTDAHLADRVRDDQIDILIDLAGHTEGNRLMTFARRPALVQATWLGYPDTTGMSAIATRAAAPQKAESLIAFLASDAGREARRALGFV